MTTNARSTEAEASPADEPSAPTSTGNTIGEHVDAWIAANTEIKGYQWAQAAIAASLKRMSGERTDLQGGQTLIQAFCEAVKIGPSYFSRLVRTHETFAKRLAPGGNRFDGDGSRCGTASRPATGPVVARTGR